MHAAVVRRSSPPSAGPVAKTAGGTSFIDAVAEPRLDVESVRNALPPRRGSRPAGGRRPVEAAELKDCNPNGELG
jgi:hypothetical protein